MKKEKLDSNQLISLIYETAVDGERWPDLLDALANFIHQIPDVRPAPILVEQYGDVRQQSLTDHGGSASLTQALQQLRQPDTTTTTTMSVPAGNEQEEINQLLLGHFSKALNVAKQLVELQEKHEATLSLLDQLPIALIVVDSEGAIVESNRRAHQLFSDTDVLQIQHGRLQAKNKSDDSTLRELITHLANSSVVSRASETLTLKGAGNDNLMLILSPAQSGSFSDSHHVSIFITSSRNQHIVLPDTVMRHFELSNMEFAVANLLVNGCTIKEIAERNGTQENTVRTQVKAIFSKTLTCRQAELISLLLGGSGAAIGYGLLSRTSTNIADDGTVARPQILTLSDGRHMAYQEYGDPDGEPVFLCHSILGSRLELPFNGAEEAAARHIRLIVPDRPGRGQSTPHLDGKVLHWTDDLRTLADHLGFATFHLIGYAMGGMYAYASTYAMPERIKQVILISSGITPQCDADFQGTQPLYTMMQKMARDFPRIHRLVVTLMSRSFLKNPQKLIERLGQNLCPSDKAILKHPDFHDLFLKNLNEVYCQGANHYAHEVEIAMHQNDWGFTPQEITQPIHMWHGEQDFGIPLALGKKFQRLAPNATLTVIPDKGHYLFYDHWPMILDHMLDSQNRG
jgi:pimeloyl-ACP methyl ester carboxylesterase/DNA-binding NarL/FixJ family response regulator